MTDLSKQDQEVVRLIGQHLCDVGLRTSADVLMKEAGCRYCVQSTTEFVLQRAVLQAGPAHGRHLPPLRHQGGLDRGG